MDNTSGYGDPVTDQGCGCLVCGAMPAGRDSGIVATVEEHGWSVLRIPGTFEFAYTLGLWHTFRLPELVMFGLEGLHMQWLLNTCVAAMRDNGLPAEGVPFAGVLDGFDIQLRPVDESWRDALFGTAHRFYRGRPVPVWQAVWPDARGRWPWENDATASSRTRQAFAWLPVDQHPAGSWQLVGHFGDDFPLAAEPDSWALTSRSILQGSKDPRTVLFGDDAFDVLDDRGHDADDLCLTYLGTLVLRLPGLRDFGDLENGSAATLAADGTWLRSPLPTPLREARITAWQRAGKDRPT